MSLSRQTVTVSGIQLSYLQLTWTYAEVQRAALLPPPEIEADVVVPPVDVMQGLFELAQNGLLIKLAERAAEIGKACDRYQPFTQHIITLAKQFQIDEIEAVLQQHLTLQAVPNSQITA